jgi:hypothetical protein
MRKTNYYTYGKNTSRYPTYGKVAVKLSAIDKAIQEALKEKTERENKR